MAMPTMTMPLWLYLLYLLWLFPTMAVLTMAVLTMAVLTLLTMAVRPTMDVPPTSRALVEANAALNGAAVRTPRFSPASIGIANVPLTQP